MKSGLRAQVVRKLKEQGIKQGFITIDQINEFLGDEVTVEDMDEVHIMFNKMKLDVVDSPEEALKKRKKKDSEKARRREAQMASQSMRYDDPIRMYLREMGKVPLLDREGEISLARQIEDGQAMIEKAVFHCPTSFRDLFSLGSKLEKGKIRIEDFLQVDVGTWGPLYTGRRERQRALRAIKRIARVQIEIEKLNKKLATKTGKKREKAINAQLAKYHKKMAKELADLRLHRQQIARLTERPKNLAAKIGESQKEIHDVELEAGYSVQDIMGFARECARGPSRVRKVRKETKRGKADWQAYERRIKNAKRKIRRIEVEAKMTTADLSELASHAAGSLFPARK